MAVAAERFIWEPELGHNLSADEGLEWHGCEHIQAEAAIYDQLSGNTKGGGDKHTNEQY